MKRLLVLLAVVGFLTLGCTDTNEPPNASDAGNGWSYAKGPHGENCLLYSSLTYSGHVVQSISCDSVKP